MESDVRILLADDHPIVRQGLRRVIDEEPNLTVVAEASDGRSALEQIEAMRPQIAVLDIDMPVLNGFDVARAIRERRLPVAVIFLTVYREESFFEQALRLGTKGYVLKDSAVSDIVASIRAVAAGEHYTSPAMTSYLMTKRRGVRAAGEGTAVGASGSGSGAAQRPGAKADVLVHLTPTERRILLMIADYRTSREIGEALHVSYRTVQTHRTNICTKLELRGNHALMKFALDHKAEL
jgi:DNA-binding NarL/FixJ family response regulator